MSDTGERLVRMVESLRDELWMVERGDARPCTGCGAGTVAPSEECPGCAETQPDGWWDWTAANALELYATVRVSAGRQSLDEGAQSVTIVTGTGGPHVEIVVSLSTDEGAFTVAGYWGSDRVERYGAAPGLGGWAADYVAGLSWE